MPFIKLLDFRTLVTMGSALAVVIFFIWLCEFSDDGVYLPFYVAYRLLNIGDALFHEMGHTLFFWLFGTPAYPSILTLYGADLAGGFTSPANHSWIIQILVWVALAKGCDILRKKRPTFFWPAVASLCVAMALSFTVLAKLIPLYMGHGSAIFCGGVLLYRAWLNILRTTFERWLNALYGFFIVIHNAVFCYQLLYVKSVRNDYENNGIENDFTFMTDCMPHWRVDGIAEFTFFYAVITLILSFVLAAYFYDFYDETQYITLE